MDQLIIIYISLVTETPETVATGGEARSATDFSQATSNCGACAPMEMASHNDSPPHVRSLPPKSYKFPSNHISHNYLQQLAAKAASQPKLFWTYFHHQQKMSQVPVFIHHGIPYCKPNDIAKLCSHQFSLAPPLTDPATPDPSPTHPEISSAQTARETVLSSIDNLPNEIYKALSRLNPSQCPDQMAFILLSSKPALVVTSSPFLLVSSMISSQIVQCLVIGKLCQ